MSQEARQHAATVRRARAQQIRDLRLRVAGIAVAVFLAAWVGIFVQLTTGHDPALANDTTSVATQSADPQVVSDGTSDDASASDSSSATAPDSSSTSGSAPAAVTTRQS